MNFKKITIIGLILLISLATIIYAPSSSSSINWISKGYLSEYYVAKTSYDNSLQYFLNQSYSTNVHYYINKSDQDDIHIYVEPGKKFIYGEELI